MPSRWHGSIGEYHGGLSGIDVHGVVVLHKGGCDRTRLDPQSSDAVYRIRYSSVLVRVNALVCKVGHDVWIVAIGTFWAWRSRVRKTLNPKP